MKGVACYHMFRIMYLLDVRFLSERLILKRWTRDAKLMHKFDITTGQNSRTPELVVGMTFVNSLMTNVYNLGHRFMGDAKWREIINQSMNDLSDELLRNMMKRNQKRHRTTADTQEDGDVETFLNPPPPTHSTYPSKRHNR